MKGIQPVEILAQCVPGSLCLHSQKHYRCHGTDAPLKQGIHKHYSLRNHHGNMVERCCSQSGTVIHQCFDSINKTCSGVCHVQNLMPRSLAGLPTSMIAPLQRVQNAAARLFLHLGLSGLCDHISQGLCELHWLPIDTRVVYKLSSLMYDVHTGNSPRYISDIVTTC